MRKRVSSLIKQSGFSEKAVIAELKERGIPVKGPTSMIEEELYLDLLDQFRKSPPKTKSTTAKSH